MSGVRLTLVSLVAGSAASSAGARTRKAAGAGEEALTRPEDGAK